MSYKRFTLSALFLISIVSSPVIAEDSYITNASEVVKAANWKEMKTVTIELEEHSYSPENLVFKAGVPYKLEIKNIGEKKHYFTAPEFFRSIASRKVQSNHDGEIKAPYFLALEIMAKGGQLDLYFVPVTKGHYEFFCTVDDHRDQGMNGSVIVE